jgi:2-oxo-4-hydroxy-4-carboxy-5-ureidoimidazoline decarboxylase
VRGILARWNGLPQDEAVREILACCGSRNWARILASMRPIREETALLAASDRVWRSLSKEDWLEAFRSHPRIGESRSEGSSAAQSAIWSAQEQRTAATGDDSIRFELAKGNLEYEKRFDRIFIVCATGKSAGEILEILQCRLQNDDATELNVAAEEQRQIMCIRLKKWLSR